MEIRAVFEKIAKEYPVAKEQDLKNHPLAKFIRTQVPKSFDKQQSLVFWCDAYTQGNYRSIHSEEYKSKTEKKYEYY